MGKVRRRGAMRSEGLHRNLKELRRELVIIPIPELQDKEFNKVRRCQGLTVKARQPTAPLQLTHLFIAARQDEARDEILVSVEEYIAAQKLFLITRHLRLAIQ